MTPSRDKDETRTEITKRIAERIINLNNFLSNNFIDKLFVTE
jgi:hypothetical protein